MPELQKVDCLKVTCSDGSVCSDVDAKGEEDPISGATTTIKIPNFQTGGLTSGDFEDPYFCAKFIQGKNSLGEVSLVPVKNGQTDGIAFPQDRFCQIAAAKAGCSYNPTDPKTYINCIKEAGKNPQVIVGAQKCVAILDAGKVTSNFESAEKDEGGGPVVCRDSRSLPGHAFDYPSCVEFKNWYMGLQASETGLNIYNQYDKTATGIKAQNDMAKEVQKGNGQTAGIDGAKASTLAAADAESRNKIFNTAKAGAIGTQLYNFVTKASIMDVCASSCCQLFADEGPNGIKSAAKFFPNDKERRKMMAEIATATGKALEAALKESAFKKQANAIEAAKQQLVAPDDIVDEGVLRFCQANPSDPRCLGPGARLSVGGSNYGSGFGGQNFGLGNLGTATSDEFGGETIDTGKGPGVAAANVGGVSDLNKAAAEAKDIFNAPPAARAGGGAPGAAGAGAGGAGASASANGLSNDPGVEAEKKEAPVEVTSKSATYGGAGAAYTGGGWRPGAGKKEDGAENPFASMFNKKKGRELASAKEIDSPASDLFTKISNRYSEVQKRKALMDVAEPSIR